MAHNSICTPDNTNAIACNRVVGHADKGNSYNNSVVRHHNSVVIVCNRVVTRADKGNTYNKRVVTHHNTVVIACNRICTLADKEKTIVDGAVVGGPPCVRRVLSIASRALFSGMRVLREAAGARCDALN